MEGKTLCLLILQLLDPATNGTKQNTDSEVYGPRSWIKELTPNKMSKKREHELYLLPNINKILILFLYKNQNN